MEILTKNNVLFGALLGVIFALAACTDPVNKPPDPPEDLIPRDTMVSIFVDLRILDAVIYYEQRKGSPDLDELNYQLNKTVMEKYSITRDQFERSYTYYQHDLDVIDGIYADAITRMTKMKSLIEQEE